MDASYSGRRHSVGLPSIQPIDPEKMNRHDAEYQRRCSGGLSSANNPPSLGSLASPTFPYLGSSPPCTQSGPPAQSVPASLAGLMSPPDSGRSSGEEKDQVRQSNKHSLPSIMEALGAETTRPYPPLCISQSANSSPATAPPLCPPSLSYPPPLPPPPNLSEPEPDRNGYPAISQSSTVTNPYAQSVPRHSPPTNVVHSAVATSQSPPCSAPITHSPPKHSPPKHFPHAHEQPNKLSTLQPMRSGNSPIVAPRLYPGYSYPHTAPSPSVHEPASYPSTSVSHSFGYPHVQSHPAPTAAPSNSAAYSNSTYYHPPWKSLDAEAQKTDEGKRPVRSHPSTYGESIKRHLDLFDIEASLNEIAEGSGRMLDFTRHHGRLSHQAQHSSLSTAPAPSPSLSEIDDLIKQGSRIQESLVRIREVVVAQQVIPVDQTQDHRLKAAGGYSFDEQNPHPDEGKVINGGFANGDAKKRRGRAAPPGRCHSCNRAETPEWRRGPDGARTLCNACGLHYAKLTRKMGQNNKSSAGGSNLRPKSLTAVTSAT